MNFRLRLPALLIAVLASFLLAGCVNVASGSFMASLAVFLVALLGLGIAACTDDSGAGDNNSGWQVGEGEDGGDTADIRDVPREDEECDWERCCDDLSGIDTCCSTCNYWDDVGGPDIDIGHDVDARDDVDLADARDVSDVPDTTGDDADATDQNRDATDADADPDGTWEPCCSNGRIETCFCPVGMACNYGWFEDCGDQTCVNAGEECPTDAGF